MKRYTALVIWLGLIFSSSLSLAGSGGRTDCSSDTDDCSAYADGYEWAESYNIDKVDDCQVNSDSFIDGCRAYVTEQHADDEVNAANSDEIKPQTEGQDAAQERSVDRSEQPDQ